MHRAEVVRIDGDSYRANEAHERDAQRLAGRWVAATTTPLPTAQARARKAPR